MKHLKEQLHKELESIEEKVKNQDGLMESDINLLYKVSKSIVAMENIHMPYSNSMDISVEEELGGAEKYLKHYEKTGKEIFKHLAHDEMKHAKVLMDNMPEINNKQILMDWYADIENRINNSKQKISRL